MHLVQNFQVELACINTRHAGENLPTEVNVVKNKHTTLYMVKLAIVT